MTTIIGDAQDIRDLLCGPAQHNEHSKAWRWAAYLHDSKQRAAAVREKQREIIARIRKIDDFLEAAE
jgi:hypothetical protein